MLEVRIDAFCALSKKPDLSPSKRNAQSMTRLKCMWNLIIAFHFLHIFIATIMA